ncbi:helix-turn-helix transcriptional regulator [Azospirillum baldaniorum]|uniref:helix-turn-helix transcriptional regulator n=1 Tax=Azospirillum baldaniorum TaxID=1064539 RepID=UPI00157BB2BB|nr:helix-turn-helix transcriptional regulator [Azospirillum baldaniorum]
MDLPKSLREARKAKKLTQAKVAADLGVSRPAVGQWESGETTPEPKNLLGLARLYGMEIEALANLLPGGEAAVFRAYSARNHAMAEATPGITDEEWGLVLIYRQLPEEDKAWLWEQIHREARRAGISLDDAGSQPG